MCEKYVNKTLHKGNYCLQKKKTRYKFIVGKGALLIDGHLTRRKDNSFEFV